MLSRPVLCGSIRNILVPRLSRSFQPKVQLIDKPIVTHQGRDEVDAGHVVYVVDFHVAPNTLVATALDGTFKYVRIIKMLHRLRAQVDAQVFQLARFRILESEHVQDPDEPVRRVSHRVVQRGHASGPGTTCA